jgi:hypothetical protein
MEEKTKVEMLGGLGIPLAGSFGIWGNASA